MSIKKYFIAVVSLVLFFSSTVLFAQTAQLVADIDTFQKAKVIQVVSSKESTITGTDAPNKVQTLVIEILEGNDKGKNVSFTNDFVQLEKGDVFYVRHQSNHLDGTDFWTVSDPYRLDILLYLVLVFIALIFIFGGIQGVRGLLSLIGSFVLIFYVLIPQMYAGHSVVLVSIGVASLIIVLGSYITHGFNRTTTSAVFGMIGTVLITGVCAYLAVKASHLSGYSTEEHMYLSMDTRGAIDMIGLLFGGIMIGLLGVLYDVAIGQAVAVEELFSAGKHLTRHEVYKRATRIGREHIGALVNTLAIAYVGASLPLLLLMQSSTSSIWFILNSESISTEIIRILIGSMGIILAVPITTLIASYMLYGIKRDEHAPRSFHSHHH
jgi:uncharacterized membrane protein